MWDNPYIVMLLKVRIVPHSYVVMATIIHMSHFTTGLLLKPYFIFKLIV